MQTVVHLRHYPFRFGLRVLRLLPRLQSSGCKSLPPMPDGFDPLACYRSQTFHDLWQDSNVIEVLTYLRGNCHLHIPPDWRDHLLG